MKAVQTAVRQASVSSFPIRKIEGEESYLLSFIFTTLIAVLLLLFNERLMHWFILPLILCGILIGDDAIKYFRREIDSFDPKALFGLYGYYFFFLAPILHVLLNYWMKYIVPPDDWRTWLGYMAMLNAICLFFYKLSYKYFERKQRMKAAKKQWIIDKGKFLLVIAIALLLSLSFQIYVYSKYGGFLGYITAFEQRIPEAFTGMGITFLLSESFPILAMIAFAYLARESRVLKSWVSLMAAMFIFIILQLLFGGLRGSRSNTVFNLIWAVGIIHFWVRRLPKKVLLIGLLIMFMFMYIYGFYKSAGREVIDLFRGRTSFEYLEEKTGRDIETILLGDLARADVQAFLLYRMYKGGSDFKYAFGRTYLGDICLIIPRQLWPGRPPTKVKEGTDVQYGSGSYQPNRLVSSRVYGLSGEGMLNFGPYFVPLLFVIIGFLVAAIEKRLHILIRTDSRWILMAYFIMFPAIVISSDLDNMIFNIVKNLSIPVIVVWLSSKKERLDSNYVY